MRPAFLHIRHPYFAPLVDVLGDLPDGAFDYVPNPGNWGDALIRYGTDRLFDAMRLRYTLQDRNSVVRGGPTSDTLVYGGGGAWCKVFPNAGEFVASVAHRYKHVVVLPSTYEFAPEELRHVTYFARDRVSSQRVGHRLPPVPDLAYLCERPEVERTDETLVAWRTNQDIHPGRPTPPADNNDISAKGTHASDGHEFLKLVGRFHTVNTDRLHIGIAACMMGCPRVVLGENVYFKNRATIKTWPDLWPYATLREWP